MRNCRKLGQALDMGCAASGKFTLYNISLLISFCYIGLYVKYNQISLYAGPTKSRVALMLLSQSFVL